MERDIEYDLRCSVQEEMLVHWKFKEPSRDVTMLGKPLGFISSDNSVV